MWPMLPGNDPLVAGERQTSSDQCSTFRSLHAPGSVCCDLEPSVIRKSLRSVKLNIFSYDAKYFLNKLTVDSESLTKKSPSWPFSAIKTSQSARLIGPKYQDLPRTSSLVVPLLLKTKQVKIKFLCWILIDPQKQLNTLHCLSVNSSVTITKVLISVK